MHLAKLRKEADFVIFEAAAGYSANIPLTEARKENVILAHSFFGRKLPKEHGSPGTGPGARPLLLQKRQVAGRNKIHSPRRAGILGA